MCKKIWLSMHPGNFGSDKYVHPFMLTDVKIMAHLLAKSPRHNILSVFNLVLDIPVMVN